MHIFESRVIRDGTDEADELTCAHWAGLGYSGGQFSPHSEVLDNHGLHNIVRAYGHPDEAIAQIKATGAPICYLQDEPAWTVGEALAVDQRPFPATAKLQRAYIQSLPERYSRMWLSQIRYVMAACPKVYVGIHWQHRGGRGICGYTIRHDWDQFVAVAKRVLTPEQLPYLFLHTADWNYLDDGCANILAPYLNARLGSLGQPWGCYLVGQQAGPDYGKRLTAMHEAGATWATTYTWDGRDGYRNNRAKEVFAGVAYYMKQPIIKPRPVNPRVVVAIRGVELQVNDDPGCSDVGQLFETSNPAELEQNGTILALCHDGIVPRCWDGFGLSAGKYAYTSHMVMPGTPVSSARAIHLYVDLDKYPGAAYLSALAWATEETGKGYGDVIGLDQDIPLTKCQARYLANPATGQPPKGPVNVVAARKRVTAPAWEVIGTVPASPPPIIDPWGVFDTDMAAAVAKLRAAVSINPLT